MKRRRRISNGKVSHNFIHLNLYVRKKAPAQSETELMNFHFDTVFWWVFYDATITLGSALLCFCLNGARIHENYERCNEFIGSFLNQVCRFVAYICESTYVSSGKIVDDILDICWK